MAKKKKLNIDGHEAKYLAISISILTILAGILCVTIYGILNQ